MDDCLSGNSLGSACAAVSQTSLRLILPNLFGLFVAHLLQARQEFLSEERPIMDAKAHSLLENDGYIFHFGLKLSDLLT